MFKKIELPNGETLAYRKHGNGEKVLLLIHGNMSSSMHWDTVMERLPDYYTAYAVDMRGFGASSYNNRFNSLRDLSNDIKLFCDALKLDKFSIVAWSTGGGVAMYFAIDYPEMVEKIVLVESVGIKGYPIFKKDENNQPILGQFLTTKEEIENDPVQVLPILKAYEDKNKDFIKFVWDNTIYTFKKPDEERYQRYLDEILMQRNLVDIDYSLVHFNISHEHNGATQGSGEVDKITQPVLVMQGENDIVVPKEMGIEMATAIGDNAKLELLPNGGHAPMEDDLDRFMKVTLEFLA